VFFTPLVPYCFVVDDDADSYIYLRYFVNLKELETHGWKLRRDVTEGREYIGKVRRNVNMRTIDIVGKYQQVPGGTGIVLDKQVETRLDRSQFVVLIRQVEKLAQSRLDLSASQTLVDPTELLVYL
jgi:hypothetical protein